MSTDTTKWRQMTYEEVLDKYKEALDRCVLLEKAYLNLRGSLEKAFENDYELIKYELSCYAMQSHCDHTHTISDIDELLKYGKESKTE